MFVYSRRIETTLDADVLVCGAGSAGVPAAVAVHEQGRVALARVRMERRYTPETIDHERPARGEAP
jgi:ribulose 1,5-bisphosphate synthetase/thiazole synthase